MPVWEEANQRGYIDHVHEHGHAALVVVSLRGKAHLESQRARRARIAVIADSSSRSPRSLRV
jgi:hypothetical protein